MLGKAGDKIQRKRRDAIRSCLIADVGFYMHLFSGSSQRYCELFIINLLYVEGTHSEGLNSKGCNY